MLDIIPNAEQMTALVGKPLYEVWEKLCALIDERYAMEPRGTGAARHGPIFSPAS